MKNLNKVRSCQNSVNKRFDIVRISSYLIFFLTFLIFNFSFSISSQAGGAVAKRQAGQKKVMQQRRQRQQAQKNGMQETMQRQQQTILEKQRQENGPNSRRF